MSTPTSGKEEQTVATPPLATHDESAWERWLATQVERLERQATASRPASLVLPDGTQLWVGYTSSGRRTVRIRSFRDPAVPQINWELHAKRILRVIGCADWPRRETPETRTLFRDVTVVEPAGANSEAA